MSELCWDEAGVSGLPYEQLMPADATAAAGGGTEPGGLRSVDDELCAMAVAAESPGDGIRCESKLGGVGNMRLISKWPASELQRAAAESAEEAVAAEGRVCTLSSSSSLSKIFSPSCVCERRMWSSDELVALELAASAARSRGLLAPDNLSVSLPPAPDVRLLQ